MIESLEWNDNSAILPDLALIAETMWTELPHSAIMTIRRVFNPKQRHT